jgi:hypothetical protein
LTGERAPLDRATCPSLPVAVFVCVDDEQTLIEIRFANVQIVSEAPS